ncbi:ABC transporter permease [Apibacter muscae]|uniref:ABC transporter permease n=1 Tax=Apibacter muscae TaxID=2509004 RepID=A0A563DHN4_9FLAO|nr:ABC transporter permease [Apibacter muscae]TWP24733.1 ABC transporter permease [Apibacter muscae]TWP29786.1 ABC transporter permease [Apibacter muscae]TWP30934.1 ABC transporter permease [Apibacter muscae]
MGMISNIGMYSLLMVRVFKKPQRRRIFLKSLMREINDLGLNSVGLVVFTSFFVGAVVAIQMYNNFQTSSFPIPDYYVGYATKVVLILEFCPTIISIVLAGKVGSFIASSIGTMRVTEQIDALEIMGVNTPSYLILPKVVASLFFNIILIMISVIMGIWGGYFAGDLSGSWASADYIQGLQMESPSFYIYYCFIKTIVFSFMIATVPSFYGYYVKGGSLEVGRSSTQAVVWTTVLIIITNLVLTQLLLN